MAIVLYVDDEPDNLELFRLAFAEDFDVLTASDAAEALVLLGSGQPIGALLSDEKMPGMSGIELLEQVSARWPDTTRLIVSAYNDPERLLAAMTRGHAHDYVTKPWSRDDLKKRITVALEVFERRAQLSRIAEVQKNELADVADDDSAIVGLDAAMTLAKKAAKSDATVLVRGETGTGKEMLARFIHYTSARKDGPFVRVNCGALSESLLESELFGHEQGAFTGAVRAKKGRFELADGGTIFLDEIGDVSPKTQLSLLRVLQERELERVGGTKTIRIDVRVIAATHRPLEQMIEEDRMRSDLFFRLNVIPIELLPLRARPADVRPLITHFLKKHSGARPPPKVSDAAIAALQSYRWPGNARELENLVQRALALGDGDTLELEDFCLRLDLGETEAPAASVRDAAETQKAQRLRGLLMQHGGNVASAAREMGVPRTTLVSQAKKYGLL